MRNVFDTLFKESLLNTFSKTLVFFAKKGISYYSCGGTAIGAVRHHNIIPWDDDIDIYVPREDYNKLMTLCEEIKEYGLEIHAFPEDGYDHSYMKILNSNTVIWEKKEDPILSGVWVDVFPLDYYNDSDENRKRYQQYHDSFIKYQSTIKKYPINIIIKDVLSGHLGLSFYKLKSIWGRRHKESYKKHFARIDKEIQIKDGEYFVSYPEGLFHIYKKEWFRDTINMPFGDFEVKLPIDYHEYLTDYYGDYMTPPPPEKQVPFHGIYYTNLKERLSLDEIKKHIKEGTWKDNDYEQVYEQ